MGNVLYYSRGVVPFTFHRFKLWKRPALLLLLLVSLSLRQQLIGEAQVSYAEAPASTKPYSVQVLPTRWHETMISALQKSEYHIKPQAHGNIYQSPNRAHNLRTYFLPSGFKLQNRIQAAENWQIDFTLQDIYKERTALRPSIAPDFRAEGELLQVQHPGFTLEYLNSPAGVRHNIVVHEKLAGPQNLKVIYQVNTNLSLQQVNDTSLVFVKNGTVLCRYNDLRVWDAQGTPLAAAMHLEPDSRQLALVVQDQDAHYPITIDPIMTTPAAVLLQGQANAQLGISVASAGDINKDGYADVVVGAHLYDNGTTDEGVAFIYHGSATGISTTPATMVESNNVGAAFGISVASAGDVNKDGFSDVVIGANFYNGTFTHEGAAFIYHGSASGIGTSPARLLTGQQTDANFGISVASAGDVNKDGYADVVVGANFHDAGQTNEGTVYIYHGSLTGISGTAATVLEGNQAEARFGSSVASAGDVNGDGYADVVIGAHLFDNGQTNEGAAFVYHGSNTGLSMTAATVLESNQANAQAGFSVASAGDVNGDGYADVVVGAPFFNKGQINEGIASIYHGSATGIPSTATAILESDQGESRFGSSVAPAGDVNGDGYADVVVGARLYDNVENAEGAAFLHLGSETGSKLSAAAVFESNQTGAQLGISVASAGDVDGDGLSDLIIGAHLFDDSSTDQGAAFIYHGVASVGDPLPVALVSFKATFQPESSVVRLQWNTASEVDNHYFSVERSWDARTFHTIGQVLGSGTTATPQTYTFVDNHPLAGITYYRLTQTDLDGQTSSFKLVSVNTSVASLARLKISPNPATDQVRIVLPQEEPAGTVVEIVGPSGRVLQQQQLTETQTNLLLSTATLPAGLYYVVIRNGQAKQTEKLLITR